MHGHDTTREVDIESLDLEARGIARLRGEDESTGKVVFIEGALPSERVTFETIKRKPSYEIGRVAHVLRASSSRVEPRCAHFGVCGGCAMQHVEPRAQLAIKQRALEDTLWHIGRIKPEVILRAIQGPDWAYRYRARLSVRYVPKKGGVLVGFHERKSSYVADMRECHVLPPHVASLLMPLRALVESLSIRDRLPQIEYAQGAHVTVLVLRVLDAPTQDDEARLRLFADEHDVQFWLQPKGPDTAHVFYPPSAPALSYELPEYGITMPYKPTDFTQVNHHINRVLVSKAIGLLDPKPHEHVLDLFCGLGNFTLPLARRAARVRGIEGSAALLERAAQNARTNALDNVEFAPRNLFEVTPDEVAAWGHFDKVLIDPPREGGLAVVQGFAALNQKPSRIVYVSCNPATLARDAAVLVHEGGYALRAAGVVNMFAHTAHVESIAVFEPAA
ncbi:MAG TPA: 23S rRNA (uracil(1939)-C(5))-methyltransferase RlmD [Burkholderiaceae bacterium]|nr:23S rRNA (uracil(1939)-C(5))-methyltransferase RlmD [Burkholderiaceae bacterium]